MAQSRSDGICVERLTPNDLKQLEPDMEITDDLHCGYLLPEEAQVRPSRLLKALQTILQARASPCATISRSLAGDQRMADPPCFTRIKDR